MTSDPNCAFVDVILSGKIDLLDVIAAKEPDDNVLFTESDSLIGDKRSVPNIGTELFDDGNIVGFVASCCDAKATLDEIDGNVNGLLLEVLLMCIRLSFSGVGTRSRTLGTICPLRIFPLESIINSKK